MHEGGYCQHKALKPADFQLIGTVLGWPATLRRPTSSPRVDRAWWHGQNTTSFTLPPQLTPCLARPLHSAPQAIRSNLFLFQLTWGEKCSDNHSLGIKCEPKKKKRKSNSTKKERNLTQSHSFALLHARACGTHCWRQINWDFAVPCNSINIVLPFARWKAKPQCVCSPMYSDC